MHGMDRAILRATKGMTMPTNNDTTAKPEKWPLPWKAVHSGIDGYIVAADGEWVVGGENCEGYITEEDAAILIGHANKAAAFPAMLEALVDAEFLLRKAAIHPGDSFAMRDNFRASAERARAALTQAQEGTE